MPQIIALVGFCTRIRVMGCSQSPIKAKKLAGTPHNYPSHECELLAIVVAIKSSALTLMASALMC